MVSLEKESLEKVGIIAQHNTWVTDLSVASEPQKLENFDGKHDFGLLLSASRDGLLKLWFVSKSGSAVEKCVCQGHRDVVSGCHISSDGQYAISCSWDRSMKIWSVGGQASGEEMIGGRVDKQLSSMCVSQDDRQIFTAGGVRIDLWNSHADVKFSFGEYSWDPARHQDWISALSFVPVQTGKEKYWLLSASWDHKVKLWDVREGKLVREFADHKKVVHCACASPDASLMASGGKEARVIMWDLQDGSKLYDIPTLSSVNAVAFNPSKYWIAMATDVGIEVWDLEDKTQIFVEHAPPLAEHIPWATCLVWSVFPSCNECLFVGHSDGTITQYRVACT